MKRIAVVLMLVGFFVGCANPIVDMVHRDVMIARCLEGNEEACQWLEDNPE